MHFYTADAKIQIILKGKIYIPVCVCVYIYRYTYIYTHTHAFLYIYISPKKDCLSPFGLFVCFLIWGERQIVF